MKFAHDDVRGYLVPCGGELRAQFSRDAYVCERCGYQVLGIALYQTRHDTSLKGWVRDTSTRAVVQFPDTVENRDFESNLANAFRTAQNRLRTGEAQAPRVCFPVYGYHNERWRVTVELENR